MFNAFRFSQAKKELIFWASSICYMNDPMEMKLGYHVVMDYLEEKEKDLPENVRICSSIKDARKSTKYLGYNCLEVECAIWQHLSNDEKTPFVISFSNEEDSLPMWNAYSDKGNGVCLCFDDEVEWNFLEKSRFVTLPFLDVAYVDIKDSAPITVKVFRDLIDEERNELYKRIKEMNNLDEIFEEKIKTLGGMFPVVAAFIKEKAYGYEREKRFACISCDVINIVKFRTSLSGNIIPYIEVPIPIDYLKKIVLGPCVSTANQKNFFLFLKSCKLDNVNIEKSSISYRTI